VSSTDFTNGKWISKAEVVETSRLLRGDGSNGSSGSVGKSSAVVLLFWCYSTWWLGIISRGQPARLFRCLKSFSSVHSRMRRNSKIKYHVSHFYDSIRQTRHDIIIMTSWQSDMTSWHDRRLLYNWNNALARSTEERVTLDRYYHSHVPWPLGHVRLVGLLARLRLCCFPFCLCLLTF